MPTRVDEEGFYYIVDRWKDMYISGGENVYPAEVENVLHQLTAIAEAAVIGIPDPAMGRGRPRHRRGQARPAADRGGCLRALRGQSRALQMPATDRFVDALPRNATGKIHKPTLRKEFSVASEVDKKVANT